MPGRLLFVCAQGSGRALLAASLAQALVAGRWEVWCTPLDDQHSHTLIEEVLREQGRTPLSADKFVKPGSEMVWEDMVILCNGATAT